MVYGFPTIIFHMITHRFIGMLSLLTALLLLNTPSVLVAEDEAPPELLVKINEQWVGDFDGMVERRLIRALVTYSKTFYFLEGGRQRGTSYELLKEFEKKINKKLKKGSKVSVIFIPVARNQLLPALVDGRGDIAVANLTITQARQRIVDFSDPMLDDVKEILVTGPSAPPIESIEDLAGKEIHVRASSSYYESLQRLNRFFRVTGETEMLLHLADEYMEDEDLLEMVNAGLIPMIIVDDHKAEFWAQIFDDITLRPDIPVNTGGKIAWAFRKNSPELREAINAFVAEHKQGTLFGNIMLKRYLRDTKWVKNALAEKELNKFKRLTRLFKKYGAVYDFDWLWLMAQAYQESRLEHNLRSPAGAVGVMQLLPSTAADPNIDIPNIQKLENNIHAGVKYLRFLRDRYFEDPALSEFDKAMFTFAAYNAGPARIAKLRERTEKLGLDPNRWFRNVERVVAREIGRETVQYVNNIYKYHIVYQNVDNTLSLKEEKKSGIVELVE